MLFRYENQNQEKKTVNNCPAHYKLIQLTIYTESRRHPRHPHCQCHHPQALDCWSQGGSWVAAAHSYDPRYGEYDGWMQYWAFSEQC